MIMKKLFIYYSLTGNGDIVAEKMSELGYEIRKVISKRRMPKVLFFRIMTGGFLAAINAKDKLVDYDADVADYDEIVIGSPIWNGKFPPAVNAVLKLTDLANKKLTFVLYSGSGSGPKAKERIQKEFPQAQVIELQEPKSKENEFEKLVNL